MEAEPAGELRTQQEARVGVVIQEANSTGEPADHGDRVDRCDHEGESGNAERSPGEGRDPPGEPPIGTCRERGQPGNRPAENAGVEAQCEGLEIVEPKHTMLRTRRILKVVRQVPWHPSVQSILKMEPKGQSGGPASLPEDWMDQSPGPPGLRPDLVEEEEAQERQIRHGRQKEQVRHGKENSWAAGNRGGRTRCLHTRVDGRS
jgi:hypothetical protein